MKVLSFDIGGANTKFAIVGDGEVLERDYLQKRFKESEKDYMEGKVKDLDDAMKELGVI